MGEREQTGLVIATGADVIGWRGGGPGWRRQESDRPTPKPRQRPG
jgi:hypothetical protein